MSVILIQLSDVEAQSALGQKSISSDGSRLSGSWRRPEELIKQANVVITGQITHIGPPNFNSANSPSYGADITVVKVLKGAPSQSIHVMLHVANFGKIEEDLPKLNHLYLFFIQSSSQSTSGRALKIMDGSDANISKIETLIAAAPASK